MKKFFRNLGRKWYDRGRKLIFYTIQIAWTMFCLVAGLTAYIYASDKELFGLVDFEWGVIMFVATLVVGITVAQIYKKLFWAKTDKIEFKRAAHDAAEEYDMRMKLLLSQIKRKEEERRKRDAYMVKHYQPPTAS